MREPIADSNGEVSPADAPRRGGSARYLAWTIVGLLALSVPWYFPGGDGGPYLAGAPLWSVVSFACYAAIAAIVALLLPHLWDEGEAGDS